MIQRAVRFSGQHTHLNWALVDQTMVSGINFLTGILLARYLGVDEFGQFVLVWMAVLFVNGFHYAMIDSPMVSIGPKQTDSESPAYFGAVVVQEVLFSCLSFLLLFGGTRLSGVLFPEWGGVGLALPLASVVLVDQFQDFLRRYFFVRGRAIVAFTLDAIRYLGQTAILIWAFIFFTDSLDTTKVLWIISIAATAAIVFGLFFVERVEMRATTFKAVVFRHWHFSKWLTGAALMIWANGNFLMIMTGTLIGAPAVGALKAAKSVMGICHILTMGLENIVPAAAARKFFEGGKQALCEYLKRVVQFGGGATAIFAVIAAVAPEFWLVLIFGSDYQGYGYLLQGFAAFYTLSFLGFSLATGLRAIEKSKVIFQSYIWMTLFTLLSFYPLITYLGLAGVIAGFLIVVLIEILTLWIGLKMELDNLDREEIPDPDSLKREDQAFPILDMPVGLEGNDLVPPQGDADAQKP